MKDVWNRLESAADPLARSEARLAMAQAVAHVGSWEIDLATRRMWGSDEAFRIYGLPPSPDGQLPLAEVQRIPLPAYRAVLDGALAALVREGREYDVRFRIRRAADGAERSIHSRAVLVRDAGGRAALVAGTLQDVTEQERLEEQLQLRQRMDSVGTLASGIAHDFNNVLVGIMGYADLLAEEAAGLAPGQRECVEAILQASRRAADLVKGLQLLTRPRPDELEVYDVAAVAGEVCAVLRETTDRLVEKELRIPPGRHHVRGSASALYHALMNLGVNAVQAVEARGPGAGGWVRFEADWLDPAVHGRPAPGAGRWVRLTVADSGTGMSPEVRDRAFDPLFTTKEKGTRQGQGLGLAMVYNVVVRQHGGAIDLDTSPGEGSAFHLLLPAGEPGGDAAVAPAAAAEVTAPRAATVLVADDEPAILRFAERALAPAGFRVLKAADGAAAAELLRARIGEVDLVVLDRTMPRLPGERVLELIRGLRPDLPVIVSSGDTDGWSGPALDTVAVLRKPFTGRELLEAVRAALAAVSPGRSGSSPGA